MDSTETSIGGRSFGRKLGRTIGLALALTAVSLGGFAGTASAAPSQDSPGSTSGQTTNGTVNPGDTHADIIVLTTDPASGLSIDELAPGDVTQWSTSIKNVSGRTVPVTAEFGLDEEVAQSPLTLDTTFGMQVTLDICDQPWTPGQSGPLAATTFTCDGTEAVMLASTPLGNLDGVPFQSGAELAADGTLNIMATMSFPREAGNDFENLKGGVRVLFTSGYADPPPPTTPAGPPSDPPTSPPGPTAPAPPVPQGPEVPVTGSTVLGVVAVGLALLAAGVAVYGAARKKKETSEHLQEALADCTTDGPTGSPETL